MAAKLALSSGVTTQIPIAPKSSSVSPQVHDFSLPKRFHRFKLQANIVGGDGEIKPKGRRNLLPKTRNLNRVREAESPMKTPLPYIIIFGLSTPFVILAIVFANGWIKVRAR